MIKQVLAISALAFAAALPVSSFAQATMDHSKMDMAKPAAMTDGEVKKVDQEAGKVTIKHGDIKHLDMPGMTMVFQVKDAALLDKVKAGDKVTFTAEKADGAIVVTAIEAVK